MIKNSQTNHNYQNTQRSDTNRVYRFYLVIRNPDIPTFKRLHGGDGIVFTYFFILFRKLLSDFIAANSMRETICEADTRKVAAQCQVCDLSLIAEHIACSFKDTLNAFTNINIK